MRTSPSCQHFLFPGLCLFLFLIINPCAFAQEANSPTISEDESNAIKALTSSLQLQVNLAKERQVIKKQLASSPTDSEKQKLEAQLARLETEFDAARDDFDFIATGTDNASLWDRQQVEFDFNKEMMSLLKPALDELKQMTSEIRKKTELRERIDYDRKRLATTRSAQKNIEEFLKVTEDKSLIAKLKQTHERISTQAELLTNRLQSAELQLGKLTNTQPISTRAGEYTKRFFQKRGLYLGLALVAAIGVLFFFRLLHKVISKVVPGYRSGRRSFRIRLFEVIYHALTFLSLILVPLMIFYFAEDWLLLSVGILFLIGIGWTLTKTLPRLWREVQLFLNIGSVREGERIFLDGLPWKVKRINVYTELENARAGLRQRIPISDLVDMKSRITREDEPWFPSRKGDWVVLTDGFVGKVVGISQEMIELVDQGGSRNHYTLQNFLDASPRNISTNFRHAEVIGIAYGLQKESTSSIPQKLEKHILESIEREGFAKHLLNLQVEFERANASSLDIVVMADFSGDVAKNYRKLQRALQRWCVDACQINGWEIPFNQLTVHQA